MGGNTAVLDRFGWLVGCVRFLIPLLLFLLPLLPQGEEAAEAEEVFVSAAEEAGAAAAPPLEGRAKKCDRFVNQAMEEMGGINICECLLHATRLQLHAFKGPAQCLQHCAHLAALF